MPQALHELDLQHLKGDKRHIYAESPCNIAFRCSYLEKNMANRLAVLGGSKQLVHFYVDRLEIYLDESYCYVNHVTGKT
ncbi:hypothetical protein PRNP1_004137 [Phytophthora ramorum]